MGDTEQRQSEFDASGVGEKSPPTSGGGARVYDRPDPPFFQRHPVIIIVLASLGLVATAMLFLFVY